MHWSRCGAALGLALVLTAGRADAAFLGPTPYVKTADSPFAGLAGFTLEDFEDGALSIPGVTATFGWTVSAPGTATDSVDGDDGSVDGLGRDGRSFYSGGNASLTITFDPAAFGGALPTAAGIVWTDVGRVTGGTPGVGGVTFSATGPGGASLGSVGPDLLGDGSVDGFTAEDRFYGVTNAAGIESITISMDNSTDWEVDHVQYAFGDVPPPGGAVPEPASLALAAAGGLGLIVRRLRRRA